METTKLSFAAKVGARITTLRLARGLSLLELSRRTQIARTALTAIEEGRSQIRPATAERIAKALGVMPESLYGGSRKKDRMEITPKAAVEALRLVVNRIARLEGVPMDVLDRITMLGFAESRRRLGLVEPKQPGESGLGDEEQL